MSPEASTVEGYLYQEYDCEKLASMERAEFLPNEQRWSRDDTTLAASLTRIPK